MRQGKHLRLLRLPMYCLYAGVLAILTGIIIYFLPPTSLWIIVSVSILSATALYYILTPVVSQRHRLIVGLGVCGMLVLQLTSLLNVLNLILLVCILVSITVLIRQK